MKFLYFLSSVFLLAFSGCFSVKPKDFTYHYDGQYTGIDTLIRIDGYYVAQRACDSAFFSVFLFYPDGLFTLATTTRVDELKDCLENGGTSVLCQYPSWGTYRIEGNTIRTQTIHQEGVGFCVIFRDYQIQENKTLVNTSDYVDAENTNLGSMKNYPSFSDNPCPRVARFYPLSKKRDPYDCPFFNKRCFRQIK